MSNQSSINKMNKKSGFTLVEIMVAVSIFAIVALVATSAFITADRVNKKAQAMKTVIDNLHFALNVISFNLQQGGTYHCVKENELDNIDNLGSNFTGANCSATAGDGGPGIIFRSPKSGNTQIIAYKLEDGKIWYKLNNDPFTPITVDNLEIDDLRFYVDNVSESGSTKKTPRVFFTVSGTALAGQGLETSFQIETVVSERI